MLGGGESVGCEFQFYYKRTGVVALGMLFHREFRHFTILTLDIFNKQRKKLVWWKTRF